MADSKMPEQKTPGMMGAPTLIYSAKPMMIGKTGWKEDMTMKMGMMKMGQYAESYVMNNWKLDLMTMTRGNRATVTLKTH